MQPKNSPEFSSHDDWLTGDWLGNEKPKTRNTFAASENHKEAERRRRQRINGHLDSLRALLLCNSKTDKASLLAKVVQRVRELKQQTSEIIMQSDQTFPSEADEIAVILQNNDSIDGKSVFKASLCCEDRANLIPDLIDILKPLPFRILRAEMVTLGGRIRNVIVLAGEKNHVTDESVLLLRNALETLVQQSSYGGGERLKRRRMFDQIIIG
ncbi:putative transcription factor bhlh107 [Phtheirospermum japonicum]|uniref:Putative transcription factor bhlh107 n=1 Tax=Phtheirospermum japonicum TaxID=374723 RepID=A0A830C8T1_9LAMI|nr:putative transcription factor bhlh107 [Phtheirospermum japonicum]